MSPCVLPVLTPFSHEAILDHSEKSRWSPEAILAPAKGLEARELLRCERSRGEERFIWRSPMFTCAAGGPALALAFVVPEIRHYDMHKNAYLSNVS